ncbi:MAG TPA: hypothetical protein VJ461_00090 [Candidatus Nanoarchaeia archaeon]|nr:hypothetical protein [Candidatus Nanoarchaeia archaeon]
MNKLTKIALVLLACAVLLGVGGGVLLAGESGVVSVSSVPTLSAGVGSVAWFECPVNNPNCVPP